MGGPLALIQNGDMIHINARKNTLDVELSDSELNKRRSKWTPPPIKVKSGTLFKYQRNVGCASLGCLTDE